MSIQKVSQYAGIRIRLKAFAFDYIVIAGYIILLAAITFAIVQVFSLIGISLNWPENPYIADLLAFTTLILPVIIYFSVRESSLTQATWGKKKAGIRVVNSTGERISRKQAFLRSLIKFLPWQIAHSCIFRIGGFSNGTAGISPLIISGFVLVYLLVAYYFLSICFNRNHRAPYDQISGTFVIFGQTESKPIEDYRRKYYPNNRHI